MTTNARVEAIAKSRYEATTHELWDEEIEANRITWRQRIEANIAADPLTAVARQMGETLRKLEDCNSGLTYEFEFEISQAIAAFDALDKGE